LKNEERIKQPTSPTMEESKIEDTKVGEKDLIVVPIRETGHFRFKLSNGGEVPKELKGSFTSKRAIDHAVELYKTRVN